ncbi:MULTISPECIES: TRAM domain-containing protein [unclassified Microbacterium]|uniref:class I SAM-dependent RNA methyltransferase n=1 Tax=unclassified Microbacterium TaxID=2609290 RepID=UPI001DC76380|nr:MULTISPECIES: TRAM domain-containing protein [unclassified Microbacterium]CAH0208541.1 23S rRNA (uracil(1939)-C(5))-methyltransferase RlmD [Microbacterium sp. Bi121]HWK78943.1 TRAM domain-containing protein [Microbacterium sp.]
MASSASDLIDLDITGIAHGGTFIARHEGRVVFVADAIPGERVRARVTDTTKSSFWRAETVEVLDASPHRRTHVWPEADVSRDPDDRAGGADLGHIALDHQRVLKRRVLAEALDKFAGPGLEAPEVSGVDDTDGTGWRTRLSLHVDADGVVGPYAARSHRVIGVSSHPLARPRIAAEALALRNLKPGRVDLVESADGAVHVLRRPERGKRPAAPVIVERVGERPFRVDADGFWQVHPRAAATLDGAVRTMLSGRIDPEQVHFDLYGGVGLLASSLAAVGATDIVTVESSRRATDHAQENLADVDATAVTARVDRYLAGLPEGARAGTVVLDPPRAGAGRAVVEGVNALRPDAVAYVACDPVALARDLGTFRELGWEVASLDAFDLFPHSHHFETVALLTR